MWKDAFKSPPDRSGEYLAVATSDHRNFFMYVMWYGIEGGWAESYYVYAWSELPPFPDFLPEEE